MATVDEEQLEEAEDDGAEEEEEDKAAGIEFQRQLDKAKWLSHEGLFEAAMQVMSDLPLNYLPEVETDDEIGDDASDAESEVSSENAPVVQSGSEEEGEEEGEEEEEEEQEGGEPSPASLVCAQVALFSAVGDALAVEAEKGKDMAEAVERLSLIAEMALQRSPLDLKKPRGLRPRFKPEPPPWLSDEGQLRPFALASEAERDAFARAGAFFGGHQALVEPEAEPALPEAETDDEDAQEDELSDG